MSREIKFRGKRIDNGEWVFGSLIALTTGYYIVPTDTYYNTADIDLGEKTTINALWEHNDFYKVIPETVGQYIETINGHEIYHHDIVKAYKYGDKETKPFIYEITYRNGTWWFGNWTWVEFLQTFRYVEVIGNIYDNPELLKEGE